MRELKKKELMEVNGGDNTVVIDGETYYLPDGYYLDGYTDNEIIISNGERTARFKR